MDKRKLESWQRYPVNYYKTGCPDCKGSGELENGEKCNMCKGTGWVEVAE